MAAPRIAELGEAFEALDTGDLSLPLSRFEWAPPGSATSTDP